MNNKNLIDKLTPEQEALLPKYLDDGLKYGLRTIQSMDELDRVATERAVKFFYATCLEKPNDNLEIIYVAGPTEANRILKERATADISEDNYPVYQSQEDTHWTQYYKFLVDNFPEHFNTEFLTKTFNTDWVELNRTVHALVLGEDVCIVVAYPMYYRRDAEFRLHDLNQPVCEYLDGTKYYAIDGLKLPDFIVATPINEVTKEMVLSIENVDFRRCMIKRLGAQKTIELLGATTLDKKELETGGSYELLGIELEGERERFPYLRMINPSTGEIHIEGVGRGAETVEEALAYRNGMKVFVAPEYIS